MTKDQIKDEIISKQDELIEFLRSFGLYSQFRADELKDERYCKSIISLKSQLKGKLGEGENLTEYPKLIYINMTDTEKAQFRMGCLIEAGKIKQSLNAHPEAKGYEDKDVVEIAKQFSAFVLAES